MGNEITVEELVATSEVRHRVPSRSVKSSGGETRRRVRWVVMPVMVLALVGLVSCGVPSVLERAVSQEAGPLIPDCVPSASGEVRADGNGNTQLTPEGIDAALASCEVTFDLSAGQLLKTDVGLRPDDHVPWMSAGDLITLRLIGSKGVIEERTDKVRFLSYPGKADIRHLTYFLVAESPEEFFEIIRRGADTYGFDQATVDHWIEGTRKYPNEESNFVVGTGYKLGFEAIYDVRYQGNGKVNVIIVTVVPSASSPEDQE